MSVFSDNLKRLLKQNNITQGRLARDLDLTTASISRYCSGEQIPRMDVLEKISSYFNVNVSDLFADPLPDTLSLKDAFKTILNQKGAESSDIFIQHDADKLISSAPLKYMSLKTMIYEAIPQLTPDEIIEVLNFIEYTLSKRSKNDNTKGTQ